MSKHNFSSIVQTIRRFLRRNPDERDPYARVRVPVRKGPSNRSAAIALKEPKD